MSDGIYDLIPWKDLEAILAAGQDCQSMAYEIIEQVNQNRSENKDNASIILIRWTGAAHEKAKIPTFKTAFTSEVDKNLKNTDSFGFVELDKFACLCHCRRH